MVLRHLTFGFSISIMKGYCACNSIFEEPSKPFYATRSCLPI